MIYIHIPFCKQLCAYCDFYFMLSLSRKQQMLQALLREMELRQDYLLGRMLPNQPQTLYFGGGTPSVLTPEELQQLIEKVKQNFSINSFSELTLEANPDDITPEYVQQLRKIGVNRLSIGIQSFNDNLLKQLRRRHSAAQAVESVKTAQAAGFNNITIDLMYGLPQQSMGEWQRDIEQAIRLSVPHISAYHLTIEPNTLFGKQQAKGLLQLPGEELSEQQFLYLHDSLEQAGYEHYEVSNFAREGFRAVHNSGYWKGFPYIGIGPSAHSFDGTSRQWNVANNLQYINSIESNCLCYEREELTPEMCFNEYLLISLRTAEGVDLQYIEKTFGEKFKQHILQHAQAFLKTGTLVQAGNYLQIPARHFLLSDNVIRELLFDE